ncbi:MAG TPA: hypothetical protein VEJ42_06640 [Streptosporangiaceae bacterium]|nr:hypothetical protein [Streptosporangiaceae bacterium]
MSESARLAATCRGGGHGPASQHGDRETFLLRGLAALPVTVR